MVSAELLSSSDEAIRRHLSQADPLILAGLLYHATGDEGLAPLHIEKIQGGVGEVPVLRAQADMDFLRGAAFDLLVSYRDGTKTPPVRSGRERLAKAIAYAVGEKPAEEDLEFWIGQLALDPTANDIVWDNPVTADRLAQFKVIVIGAGLSGVSAAIQLKQAGIPFIMFEKNADVGGTWHKNRYPGARVDLPSRFYSHSFAVNYEFGSWFSPQEDMNRYTGWCFDHFDVRRHVRLESEVTEARWDEENSEWVVRVIHDGSEKIHRAPVVFMATGLLDRPSTPDIPGLEKFKGEIIHTAEFDRDLDVSASNIAVIGTGSTGMQLVPDIAPRAKSVTVFQRTPGWVTGLTGYRDEISEEVKWLSRNLPFYNNWMRFMQSWMISGYLTCSVFSVDDNWDHPNSLSRQNEALRQQLIGYMDAKLDGRPDLRAKCLPTYPPAAKRLVVDNGWFDALLRDNVALVTDAIEAVDEDGVVTAGQRFPMDLIVLATGFRANDFFWPINVIGKDGVPLQEIWGRDGARAYWGVTIPQLPNFFALYGPNTNPRCGNPILFAEAQVRYALQCCERLISGEADSIEVKADAFESFNSELDRRLSETIWMDGRQNSYYQNAFGRSATNSPWYAAEYWNALQNPNLDDYDFRVIQKAFSAAEG